MAAEAKIVANITVTGLGSEDQIRNTFSTNTVPAEVIKTKPIISTSYALDTGGSGISASNTLYVKAISATVYVCFGVTSGAISVAQFKIPEGQSAVFPLNVTDQATAAACVPITSIYFFCSTIGQAEQLLLATG